MKKKVMLFVLAIATVGTLQARTLPQRIAQLFERTHQHAAARRDRQTRTQDPKPVRDNRKAEADRLAADPLLTVGEQ